MVKLRTIISRKLNECMWLNMPVSFGVLIGFLIGISIKKIEFPSGLLSYTENTNLNITTQAPSDHGLTSVPSKPSLDSNNGREIYISTNPRGAERLPPGIIVSESDFYMRRLWGEPNEDLPFKPKYLVTFTVGYDQSRNIDAAVKKFSENFTILLFHYDGRTSEWDQFEWSKRAIHVSARKQTKWWFAKRVLHPDIVAAYDYIFIWDEDLGLEHFNGEKYIEIVKKHGLEISQPALDPTRPTTWRMTKRAGDQEIHKTTEEPGWCSDPHEPPCAAFIEIMAPVFSRDAWRCVWYMIQNDLVHGWGIDFALKRCVKPPAYQKIGVVDAQWIVHQAIPSLGDQGERKNGKAPRQGVRDRCKKEWERFQYRIADADKEHSKKMGIAPPNFTLFS